LGAQPSSHWPKPLQITPTGQKPHWFPQPSGPQVLPSQDGMQPPAPHIIGFCPLGSAAGAVLQS